MLCFLLSFVAQDKIEELSKYYLLLYPTTTMWPGVYVAPRTHHHHVDIFASTNNILFCFVRKNYRSDDFSTTSIFFASSSRQWCSFPQYHLSSNNWPPSCHLDSLPPSPPPLSETENTSPSGKMSSSAQSS